VTILKVRCVCSEALQTPDATQSLSTGCLPIEWSEVPHGRMMEANQAGHPGTDSYGFGTYSTAMVGAISMRFAGAVNRALRMPSMMASTSPSFCVFCGG
jgi:hypothetical protein